MGSFASCCKSKCCCGSSNRNLSNNDDSVSVEAAHPVSSLICPNCGRDFSRAHNIRDFPNHIVRCAGRRPSKGMPSNDTPYEAKRI